MLVVQEHKQQAEASTSGKRCIGVVVDLNEMIDDGVDDDPLPLSL